MNTNSTKARILLNKAYSFISEFKLSSIYPKMFYKTRFSWYNSLNIDTYDISMILDDEVMA